MAFTEADLRPLLLAVGLAPDQEDYSLSFDQLHLDSLARVELATRVEDRFGIVLEVAAEQSPADVATLVNAGLGEAVS
ncbi:phosphopantetheine-binding protein [Nonomuraea typhae]|uniref:Phosphopantetheine-binding protein n=1 Tax=Nonomuraea typhae TaxID=2603600 RepID=A0ABW7YLE9_9ACTN